MTDSGPPSGQAFFEVHSSITSFPVQESCRIHRDYQELTLLIIHFNPIRIADMEDSRVSHDCVGEALNSL